MFHAQPASDHAGIGACRHRNAARGRPDRPLVGRWRPGAGTCPRPRQCRPAGIDKMATIGSKDCGPAPGCRRPRGAGDRRDKTAAPQSCAGAARLLDSGPLRLPASLAGLDRRGDRRGLRHRLSLLDSEGSPAVAAGVCGDRTCSGGVQGVHAGVARIAAQRGCSARGPVAAAHSHVAIVSRPTARKGRRPGEHRHAWERASAGTSASEGCKRLSDSCETAAKGRSSQSGSVNRGNPRPELTVDTDVGVAETCEGGAR